MYKQKPRLPINNKAEYCSFIAASGYSQSTSRPIQLPIAQVLDKAERKGRPSVLGLGDGNQLVTQGPTADAEQDLERSLSLVA